VTGTGIAASTDDTVRGVEFKGLVAGIGTVNGGKFTRCSFNFCTSGLNAPNASLFEDCVFMCISRGAFTVPGSKFLRCLFAGSSNGAESVVNSIFVDCEFAGGAIGASTAVGSWFIDCEFWGLTTGASLCQDTEFIDCNFHDNTRDFIVTTRQVVTRNCLLSSATQVLTYNTAATGFLLELVCYDIGQVAGQVKAWMHGGRIVPDLTTIPSAAFAHSHQFIFERAETDDGPDWGTPVYVDFPISADGAGRIDLTIYLRRDTDPMTETMRAQIIDLADDPLFGGTPLAEAVMTAGANAWQSMALTTVISDSQQVALRLYGRNASGNAWAQWQVTPPVALDPALAVAITEDSLVVEVTD